MSVFVSAFVFAFVSVFVSERKLFLSEVGCYTTQSGVQIKFYRFEEIVFQHVRLIVCRRSSTECERESSALHF